MDNNDNYPLGKIAHGGLILFILHVFIPFIKLLF